jgi:peptide/nickel transport system substrate-binding protein
MKGTDLPPGRLTVGEPPHPDSSTPFASLRRAQVSRRDGLGLFGAAASTFLAACGPSFQPADGSSSGGRTTADAPITIVNSWGVRGMDPVVDALDLILWGMGEQLARLSRKGELEPWLAAGWRVLDPLRWEIKLRDGVTFWDGSPVDATAVKASLERTMSKSAVVRQSLRAAAIEVADPRTLVIRTEAPNASLPSAFAEWRIIIHNAMAAQAVGDEAFALQPVLTGPFRPAEFKKDEVTTLVPYASYWGGKPFLSRILAKQVVDGNTRVLALQSGDADMVLNLPVESVSTFQKQPGIKVLDVLSGAVEFVLLNLRTPPLDDLAVRRAISLGIDRRILAEQVLGGTVEVAGDGWSPIFPWAMKQGYPTDVKKAAQVLDDAGWRRGADGIRQKDGKPLAFTMLWYPQRTDLQPMGISIQAQLKTLGFKVELRQVQDITAALKGTDWGATLWYNNTAPGGDPQLFFDNYIRSEGIYSFGGATQEMDRMIEQIRTTVDASDRFKVVRRAQDILTDRVYFVPLVAKKDLYAVNERLKGFRPHPIYTYMIDANFGR